MTMKRIAALRRDGDRGAAAVEFALVAIPLLTLLIGIITFGFVFMAQITVTQAAREGARLAAICDQDATCLGGVKTKVESHAPGLSISDDQITVDQCPADASPGDTASATVSVNYNVQVPGPFGSITVHGKSSTPCGG
jgi:Flp pilus assembly protein TadG